MYIFQSGRSVRVKSAAQELEHRVSEIVCARMLSHFWMLGHYDLRQSLRVFTRG